MALLVYENEFDIKILGTVKNKIVVSDTYFMQ